MGPFEEAFRLKSRIEQQRIHFIRNELALAMTFLDLATATQQRDTRERNIQNARKAHDEVASLLAGNLECTEEERADLEDTLVKLKARLTEETYA